MSSYWKSVFLVEENGNQHHIEKVSASRWAVPKNTGFAPIGNFFLGVVMRGVDIATIILVYFVVLLCEVLDVPSYGLIGWVSGSIILLVLFLAVRAVVSRGFRVIGLMRKAGFPDEVIDEYAVVLVGALVRSTACFIIYTAFWFLRGVMVSAWWCALAFLSACGLIAGDITVWYWRVLRPWLGVVSGASLHIGKDG